MVLLRYDGPVQFWALVGYNDGDEQIQLTNIARAHSGTNDLKRPADQGVCPIRILLGKWSSRWSTRSMYACCARDGHSRRPKVRSVLAKYLTATPRLSSHGKKSIIAGLSPLFSPKAVRNSLSLNWVFRVRCGNETCCRIRRLPYSLKPVVMIRPKLRCRDWKIAPTVIAAKFLTIAPCFENPFGYIASVRSNLKFRFFL